MQCGLGRTGKLWAHEHFGVAPDIMTLAKPLAGGLPIGAVLVTDDVNSVMQPGDHGSTFAGGALVTAAASAVFDIVNNPKFLDEIASKGDYMKEKLQSSLSNHVTEIRGLGLLVGVQLDCPAGGIVSEALKKGLVVITAGKGDVVRLAPPLIAERSDIDEACRILSDVFSTLD